MAPSEGRSNHACLYLRNTYGAPDGVEAWPDTAWMPAGNRGIEAAGKRPTTFNIAAEVYRVRQDQYGNRMVSDAQYFSTERALASLGRKGLVTGQQHFELVRSMLDGSQRALLFVVDKHDPAATATESR